MPRSSCCAIGLLWLSAIGLVGDRPHAHSRLTWPDRAWLALLAGTVPTNPWRTRRARHHRWRPSTVWQILKSAGINRTPRPDGPVWAEFLPSQTQGILTLDIFTPDLRNGTKVYVLAAIERGTRCIRISEAPSIRSSRG